MQNDRLFIHIVNILSLMSDSEIRSIDYDAAIKALESVNISDYDKNRLNNLFNSLKSNAYILHYGIKGMRWGHRKNRELKTRLKKSIFGTGEQFEIPIKNGDKIVAKPLKKWSLGKKIFLSLIGIEENNVLGRRGDANYELYDKNQKRIGELSLINKNSKSAYIDWIGIDENNRGKGYGSAVLDTVLKKAKDSGYSKVELNALKRPRSLYERKGFTYSKVSPNNIIDHILGFEFGCKRMEYDLSNYGKKIVHSLNGGFKMIVYSDELYHYGIKGMRWGHRKDKSSSLITRKPKRKPLSKKQIGTLKRITNSSEHVVNKLAEETRPIGVKKKIDLSKMSDDELRRKINRANLERQYDQLFNNEYEINKGQERVHNILVTVGAGLAVTSSALEIALAIKDFRNKG